MDAETFSPPHFASVVSKSRTDRAPKYLLCVALAVQAAHLLVLLLFATERVYASNMVQMVPPSLCTALCFYEWSKATSRYQGKLWLQLSAAFLLWVVAQFFSFAGLHGYATILSDILWLACALPVLLVATRPSKSIGSDPVGWLEAAQSGLLFGILFVLVYPHPGILKPPLSFEVENLAMLLATALRYSISQPGEERLFYRHIVVYVGALNVCSVGADLVGAPGPAASILVDLCRSLPFTAFCLTVLCGRRLPAIQKKMRGLDFAFPRHLHGISALGIVAMSLAGAAVLAWHDLFGGVLTLVSATLLFAVRAGVREWQLQAAHTQLQHIALHDPLTGLANRNLLKEELNRRLRPPPEHGSRSGQEAKRACLLFIDLDRFKIINDGLGHAFGDLLLIRVATLIKAAVRPEDIVARHGGDEFVVLLDRVDEAEAEALGQRVNQLLREPMKIEDRLMHITCSIGLVMSEPGATADSIIQDADCAMYKAKGSGKDRAQTFAPDMLVAAKRKLGLETDLRASLSAHEIKVQYQPIFKLTSSQRVRQELHGDFHQGAHADFGAAASQDQELGSYTILGFEALAVWRHPVRGLVPPSDFIPIAEDTGLIVELGKQVLYQACCECHGWNQRFKTRLTVSVNVSALQFMQPGLLGEVKAILRASGLDPRLLKLEITESVLLSGYDAVEEVLIGARALGIGVCLDDFGTGYSSLSYLLRLPFDVLKIDRSFVRHLDSDHRRADMVRMVIQLAETLKKGLVVEGIETPGELAQLRLFGCDMVQGFLLSRPLLPAAVEKFLQAGAPIFDAELLLHMHDKPLLWELDVPALHNGVILHESLEFRHQPSAL